jgi:hypothetical protein
MSLSLIGLLGSSVKGNTSAKDKRLPHAQAIELVIKKKKDELANLEIEHFKRKGMGNWQGKAEDYSWFDTVDRSWKVTRPFAPGLFDSTHWFVVVYAVDGESLANYTVDLKKGTVQSSSSVPSPSSSAT